MSIWANRYSPVVKATRDGTLKKAKDTICERCGKPATHRHHDDYSKPLEVTYLCSGCHAKRHQELGWGFDGRPATRSLLTPEIEKGIPWSNIRSVFKQTLLKTKVGDSFRVETVSDTCNCRIVAVQLGMKIKTHKLDNDGYRVWRIA